jgi:hypothetical protein
MIKKQLACLLSRLQSVLGRYSTRQGQDNCGDGGSHQPDQQEWLKQHREPSAAVLLQSAQGGKLPKEVDGS